MGIKDESRSYFLLIQIYKKFLIGSKVLEKLDVCNDNQLQTLVQVALAHPTSLQQLLEVQYRGSILESLYDIYNDEMAIFDKYCKVNKHDVH
jgi:hypothetical protein